MFLKKEEDDETDAKMGCMDKKNLPAETTRREMKEKMGRAWRTSNACVSLTSGKEERKSIGDPGGTVIKYLPAPRSLGGEDPLEEEIAIHSSILAWEITWTKKPGRLPSTGSQRVRHHCVTKHTHTHTHTHTVGVAALGKLGKANEEP